MCAMTLATTSAKLLPMRWPEVEKGAGPRSFSFQQNLVYLAVENLFLSPQTCHSAKEHV